jgi:uncharacterized protein Yka (UPF0111/DUF47 family)
VVIGILIALSINNWNEGRKTNIVEINLLNEVRQNLHESQKNIVSINNHNKRRVEGLYKLINYVELDLPYNSELDTIFGALPTWSSPYLIASTYETLKTKGVDIIQNDSLRKEIIKMYESKFTKLNEDWDLWEWNINQDIVMPFFADYVKALTRPINIEILYENFEFQNILLEHNTYLKIRNRWLKNTLKELDKLLEDIQNEIERLEN